MSVPDTPEPLYRGSYFVDASTRAAYSEGAGPLRIVPAAVAIPCDVPDLVRLIHHARTRGLPLTPRGAASGMPGGNLGSGIVVDLQSFDRTMVFGPDRTVIVGASVTWGELAQAAGSRGLRLPPDPSSGRFCTIGGMVSTNAAGPQSVKYGSIRPWVRGIEIVTADGEVTWLRRGAEPDAEIQAVHRFERGVGPTLRKSAVSVRAAFPRTTKNSAGYALDHYVERGDLLDLVIGSEGTLVVVTRIELQLIALPESEAAILIALDDLAAMSPVVALLRDYDPSGVELMDRTLLHLGGAAVPLRLHDVEALLLVRLERSSDHELHQSVNRASAALAPLAQFVETATTAAELTRLWSIRHAASPALASLPETRRSLQIVEDGCVPVSALGRYIAGVRQAAEDVGIEIVAFGHAGDGHLHVNALTDLTRSDYRTALEDLYERVTDLVITLGGTPSGEHGDGRVRAPAIQRVYDPAVIDLFRSVRAAFDPNSVLNPGTILPDETLPLDRLKVGAQATPIPAEIARGLREMERAGGWGRAKSELAERGMSS